MRYETGAVLLLLISSLLVAPATAHEGHSHAGEETQEAQTQNTSDKSSASAFEQLYGEYSTDLAVTATAGTVVVLVSLAFSVMHYRKKYGRED